MSIHVRVIAPVVPTGLTQLSDFEGVLAATDKVSLAEIDEGPVTIESGDDVKLAVPAVVREAMIAERDGADAIVLDCMADPGLRPARGCVAIPVVGPCECAVNLAAMLGHRFSIIAANDAMRPYFATQTDRYGAKDRHASTRALGIPVASLADDPAALRRALTDQALLAVHEDGADTIILGCTGMIGVAETLRADLAAGGHKVSVIDPIPAALRMAKLLAEANLAHTKIAYPKAAMAVAPEASRGAR